MKPTKICYFRDVISVVSSQTRNGTYIMHITRVTYSILYYMHQSSTNFKPGIKYYKL